jgi:diguanylate cyclase (GGDEF)-like protein
MKRPSVAAKERPSLLARLRLHPSVIAIALAGLLWSLGSSTFVWRWENRQAEHNLQQAASNQFLALQTGLNEYLNKLNALRAFFEASDEVSRNEFELFANRLLERQKAIQNFSWVQRVTGAERAAHEAAARRDGLDGYSIRALTDDERIVASPDHDEYFPLLYSTVKDYGSRIYGIDLFSEPPLRSKMERARDLNELSTVPDFILHSREGNVHGFLFSLPVYRHGADISTIAARRRNLVGFVHGAFVTREAVDHILSESTSTIGLRVSLFAPDAGPDAQPIHVRLTHEDDIAAAPRTREEIARGLHVFGALRAGDTQWILAATPTPGGPLEARHDRAWLVLAANLLVSVLVTLYMQASARHARKLLSANKKISDLAQQDPLTKLANRRAFSEHLGAAFEASQHGAPGFAVLYFDLDEFKDINDTRGHPAGDVLLQQVAERLCAVVRAGDLAARFGGDEFAVLQANATPASAMKLAQRINETLAAPYTINGSVVRVTASIGIAQFAETTKKPEALLMEADLALYRAKEDGRNCFRFHNQELDRAVRERVVVAAELREALQHGQFRLWYQPQVALDTGKLIGVEALLRWQHPTRGLLTPSDFIGVAEHTGMIEPIGEWVFEEACRQLRAWQDAGLAPGTVAINVSGTHIKANAELAAFMAETLRTHNIAPSHLEVELTESVLMEATQQHSATLEGLRALGLRIAIDDFGTGYSSLNYLTQYPVHRLKIAQELVFGVATETRYAAVVRAAIHLAKELGIECIAEGVETAQQAAFLIEAGCQYGQGYHFARPLSARKMTDFLAKRGGFAVPKLALVHRAG